ncbi:ImmA/IrrE family metallo-endopeptidase [uncultured Succinatimonas sp.]|uniref:ImmA/IrrE family metallo-endopeptidase n=1 Tax=uncultured Succinatimonas sp. TaxID=1262973 RepID=UPI0025E20FEA|nr:ImmA/IrrE family metallo-endopeptidase [uncultured Succinatimonas sp.]
MTVYLPIKLNVLEWAYKRAGLSLSELFIKHPGYKNKVSGLNIALTMSQVKEIATHVHIPLGFLFLSEPFEESLSIKDFRTLNNKVSKKISLNLRDVINQCQLQQDWYIEYAEENELEKCSLVNKSNLDEDPKVVAEKLKIYLNYKDKNLSKADDYRRYLRAVIEQAGVLVFISSTVGNNNTRPLDINEFRGFALSDPYAPLIFINSSDSVSAQIFTMIHELAHIMLGESGISNEAMEDIFVSSQIEKWCNAVAANFLVPEDKLKLLYEQNYKLSLYDLIVSLVFKFHVSSLVILRRLYELNLIEKDEFSNLFNRLKKDALKELQLRKEEKSKKSLPYYQVALSRLSKNFCHAVISSTLSGNVLYRDACILLNKTNLKGFDKFASTLGYIKAM